VSVEALPRSQCIACHGADGKGVLPGVPNFTDRAGRLSNPDSEFLANIINEYQSPGSPMPMPPKGGNSALSDTDIASVWACIREQLVH
jgi:mono/diheme cytochrome c family protein